MLEFFFNSAIAYMTDRLPPVLIGTALVLGLRWLLILLGRLHRGTAAHEIGVGLFTLYAAVVISLTFLPISFDKGYFQFNSALLLMLRGEYTADHWGFSMVLGNILMFVPLGFLPPLLWKWFRWFRVLLISLIAILCIELLQPLAGRSFDIDDLILNSFGSIIGLAISVVLQTLFPRHTSTLQA